MSLQLLLDHGAAEQIMTAKPSCSGWLNKRNNSGRVQPRFCIIVRGYFLYYLDETSKKPRGGFTLAGYSASPAVHDPRFRYAFVIECKQFSHQRDYFFAADNEQDQRYWMYYTNKEAKLNYPDIQTTHVHDWIQVTQKDAEKKQNPYEYTKPHPPKGVRSPPPEDKKDDIMMEIQTKNSPQLPHRKKNGKQHVEKDMVGSHPPAIPDNDYLKLLPEIKINEKMRRDEAEKLLVENGRAGVYIVRNNGKDVSNVLSVYTGSNCKHYIIFCKENRKFLHDVPEPKFHELSDLLRYYSRNKLPTCDAKLSQPLMELYSDYSES